jgi:hypothetical protein
MDSSDESNKSFVKHVFNFDDDTKGELINIIQYTFIGVIPIIILNKSISKYIPEADDSKGSLEISAEIVIQLVVMFFGLYMIHRVITFFPTYSGAKYEDYNVITSVLTILMITLSLQTKIGEKTNILIERLMDLWDGKDSKSESSKSNGKKANVKVSQPIAGQQQAASGQITNHPMYNDGTSINSLPSMPQMSNPSATQQLPNYDNMYQKNDTPLVNASSPGQMESFEPMAANSALGGGFGSTW